MRFYFLIFKLLAIFVASLVVFYFFETTFLIETALAEEVLTAESNAKQVSTDLDTTPVDPVLESSSTTIPNSSEMKKEVEPSFFKKLGYFFWDYKWTLLLTGAVVLSCVFVYGFFTLPNPPLEVTQAAVALQDPMFPHWGTFIEKADNFSYSLEATKDLPEHFTATKAFFAEASRQNLMGILVENPSLQTNLPFRVYPAMPILHEDPNLSILVNQHNFLNEGIITTANNPFGYSNDPSMIYWIDHAKAVYPVLNHLHPSLILQYQKVALVDPFTCTYAYFHQVSVVPLNIEALSTPYETALNEQLLKVYLFKDNESGWAQ